MSNAIQSVKAGADTAVHGDRKDQFDGMLKPSIAKKDNAKQAEPQASEPVDAKAKMKPKREQAMNAPAKGSPEMHDVQTAKVVEDLKALAADSSKASENSQSGKPEEGGKQGVQGPKGDVEKMKGSDAAATEKSGQIATEEMMASERNGAIAAADSLSAAPGAPQTGAEALTGSLTDRGVDLDTLSSGARDIIDQRGGTIDRINSEGVTTISDVAGITAADDGLKVRAVDQLTDDAGNPLDGAATVDGEIFLDTALNSDPQQLKSTATQEVAERTFQDIAKQAAAAGAPLTSADNSGRSVGDFGADVAARVDGTLGSEATGDIDNLSDEVTIDGVPAEANTTTALNQIRSAVNDLKRALNNSNPRAASGLAVDDRRRNIAPQVARLAGALTRWRGLNAVQQNRVTLTPDFMNEIADLAARVGNTHAGDIADDRDIFSNTLNVEDNTPSNRGPGDFLAFPDDGVVPRINPNNNGNFFTNVGSGNLPQHPAGFGATVYALGILANADQDINDAVMNARDLRGLGVNGPLGQAIGNEASNWIFNFNPPGEARRWQVYARNLVGYHYNVMELVNNARAINRAFVDNPANNPNGNPNLTNPTIRGIFLRNIRRIQQGAERAGNALNNINDEVRRTRNQTNRVFQS